MKSPTPSASTSPRDDWTTPSSATRLDRTFQAVTRADLYTLVADLPPKLAPPIRPRRAEIPALLIVLIVVIALAVETGGLVFPVWLVVLLACWQPWRSSGRRPVPPAHIGSARL